MVNFSTLLKVFDTVMSVRNATKSTSRETTAEAEVPPNPLAGLAGQLEARLANVVVAALKEAFDRDHARLELERAQLEEQRRRADEAIRRELRQQAADREVARLRLLAATALVGWIASMSMLVVRFATASIASRGVAALGWLLLVASLGAAFTAQARISSEAANLEGEPRAGTTGVGSALAPACGAGSIGGGAIGLRSAGFVRKTLNRLHTVAQGLK
jgi:hypothetical protein